MTFAELWEQVNGLSETAKKHVPNALSKWTKRRLSRLTIAEVEKIITEAIEEVNNGSTETLEKLVKKRL